MLMVHWYLLATLGLVIVLGLGSYAIHLWIRLQQQKQSHQAAQAEAAADGRIAMSCADKHEARRRSLLEQLDRLARAALHDGVNLSEITIRSRYLLDHLDPAQEMRARFEGIYTHYEAVKDFAIKDARQALSPAERRQEDLERERLEQANGAAVRLALEELLKLTQTQPAGGTRH